jgi:hypothetical protein
MKIYIINWGYYSTTDGSQEIEAIYSTQELALAHIKNIAKDRRLTQQKHKKTKKLLNFWSDGDYWISFSVGYMDSPILYMSPEEYNNVGLEQ